MKKILSIIFSITILTLIMINPVSAELKDGYIYYGIYKSEFKYEDIGDFRYIYRSDGEILEVLYKKRSSKQEIKRIEFPAEHKGKQVNYIGFIGFDRDPKVKNLKVNTIFIPKTIDRLPIHCVYNPVYDDGPYRLISLRNVEVDKENPYLCSKDGVLYSKDMKIMHLFPDRNSMTVYKMPNTVEEYWSNILRNRNNLKKLYLSDNLKSICQEFAASCKNLEYVYIGTKTETIERKAFSNNKKLKTVKIKSKKLEIIHDKAFANCTALKKINIPSTVKTINFNAFQKCTSLKKINLSSNMKRIESCAFWGCKNLSKVTLDNKKKSPKIGENAFKNTKKGIKFVVKNKKVAKSLKKQLKGSGVRDAKILIGKKVIYKNING